MFKFYFLIFIELSLCIFHACLAFFVRLIGPLFSSKIKERKEFELENKNSPFSRSFALDQVKADVAFEVSSEGELEQVRPLIDDFLERGDRVELIYFSPSVEKKIQTLASSYPKLVRVMRFPVLTYSFYGAFGGQSLFVWMTAKKLILSRYDFFPELLLMGARNDVEFILISGSLKSREKMLLKNSTLIDKITKYYWSGVYGLFDFIITATLEDKKRFIKLGILESKIDFFDFRIIQIFKRLENKEKAFEKILSFNFFEDYLNSFDKKSRFIMGSAWPIEMKLFQNKDFLLQIKNAKIQVTIAPHKLKDDDLDLLKKTLLKVFQKENIDLPLYVFSKDLNAKNVETLFLNLKEMPGILIFALPGVLCELYSLYGQAYVGGGHGKSIHSVLEPYVACARVYCGPKVFRSTEFDIVSSFSPEYIHRIEEFKEFYPLFLRNSLSTVNEEEKIKNLLKNEYNRFQDMLKNVR